MSYKNVLTTRRQFLSNCGHAVIASIGIALSGCIDMDYSPFETKTDHENQNAENLKAIKEIETAHANQNYYKIGLMSDTHHFYSETEEVVNIFNSRNDLDFIIVIGDTTNEGLIKEFNWGYDIIKKINCPFINMIGNHDCIDYGIEIFEKMYGDLNFTFSFLGTDFICFNNNNWESGDPDYEWLKNAASSGKADQKILLSHIDNSNDAYNRFSPSQIDTFNSIVGDYFDCAIHGHAHEQSSEQIVTGVPRYQIGSPGYGHYMILTNDYGTLRVERCTF